mgnify:CR=1 FL=1
MGIILFCFIGNSKGISYEIKALRAGDAHSHEDEECRKRRARRENVLRHILSYCYFFVSGREKINSVPTPSVLITLIFSLCA